MNQNGKAEGFYRQYYDDGTIEKEANYKNGKIDGIEKTLYSDGSYCETLWKHDVFVSKKCFDAEKNPINLSGIVKFYHKNGKLAEECNYKNQKMNGLCTLYYTSGNIRNSIEYQDNKRNGNAEFYNLLGKLETSRIYKDGKLLEETEWKDGKRNGISQTFYESGKIKSFADLKDNIGTVAFYGEDDTLISLNNKMVCNNNGCNVVEDYWSYSHTNPIDRCFFLKNE